MLIALDYDGTFTADPDFWLAFVHKALSEGHEVFCCTMRYPHECASIDIRLSTLVQIIATSRKAKMEFMREVGVVPQIWIDDQPHFIVSHAAGHDSVDAALQNAPKTKAKLVLKRKES